ncbi:MAG: hypothetical protein IRZ03_08365 [Acidobacterium ailaaui]|nr:hypothetical protein [Pseudacidobacterium ailaaui]
MAFTEYKGNGNFGEREFVSAKIGVTLEGTFRGMSPRMPSQFGGEYRIVNLDLTDGREVAVPASKILMERLEGAGLADGDAVKIVVESAKSKAGRTYANPRLFIDKAATPAPEPAQASRPLTDEPPF